MRSSVKHWLHLAVYISGASLLFDDGILIFDDGILIFNDEILIFDDGILIFVFLDEDKTQEGGRGTDSTPSDTQQKDSPLGNQECTQSGSSVAMATAQGDPSLDGGRGAEGLADDDDIFAMITDQEVTVSKLEDVSDTM